MSAIIWGLMYFWIGLAAFLVAPILLAPRLTQDLRQRVANQYFYIAMLILDRGMLIARKHGGYSLVTSDYDGSIEAEKVEMRDETLYFEDPFEFTTSLFNRRFALADEERNVIINPRVAELGEKFHEFYHEGDHEVPISVEGEKATAFNSILELPEKSKMVNLRQARWLMPGTARPKIVESIKDDIEKSQLGYKERNYVDLMIGVVAFGATFGMIVAASWLLGGGGGGGVPGVNIGLFLGGWF